MRKIHLFLAVLCCAFIATMPVKAADRVQKDGIYYYKSYLDGKNVGAVDYSFTCYPAQATSNYSYLSGNVAIASAVDGIGTIEKVRGWAFYLMDANVNITLPNTIKEIGTCAFEKATGLLSIHLNEGITSLGQEVFKGCSNLVSVNIPSTITSLPEYVFCECKSLPTIDIPNNISIIGPNAFESCTNLQSVNNGKPLGVESIGKLAFRWCENLQTIKFSTSLKSIGDAAFIGCKKLESIELPENLVKIGEYAFKGSGLKTVTNYRTTPQVITANVFEGVDLSKCTLYVPAGCKEAYKKADVWKKFGYILEPGEAPEVTPDEPPVEPITTGTQKIGNLYFDLHADQTATLLKHDDYKNLSGAITVPSSVYIEGFYYTVNELSDSLFEACDKLTSVKLPYTITEIPDRTFMNCSSLTKITLPSSLTKIKSNAFRGCEKLESISLPLTLTEIGYGAFEDCKSLSSVNIPAGVKVILNSCLSGCENLSSVSLPSGLVSIESNSFSFCKKLSTLTIPSSVQEIKTQAFNGCTGLIAIKCESETPPTISGTNVFAGVPWSTCILYVPNGSKDAYVKAEGWKVFKNIRETGVNQKIKYGDLYYWLNENCTAYVTYEGEDESNYSSLSGEVTVLDKVNFQGLDYTVTEVGEKAFRYSKNITKVNLPKIMDKIQEYAFSETNLSEINIPATLTFLSNTAFENTKLYYANMDDIGAVYYDGCLLYCPVEDVSGTYNVKEGTRLIASNVFSRAGYIRNLYIPEGVQCICEGAIDRMRSLQTLSLPSTLYLLGEGFCSSNCKSLNTIYNYSEKPLELAESGYFDNWTKEQLAQITLYVPAGTRTAYQAANKWKDFPIMEMKAIYTVTFVDYDGSELSVQRVQEGNDAHLPEEPEREGYNFIGWDKDVKNIQSNLTITAQYERKKFTVRFFDMGGTAEINSQQVEWGLSAIAPEPPVHNSFTFMGWDKEFDIVTSDMDVTALYKEQESEIKVLKGIFSVAANKKVGFASGNLRYKADEDIWGISNNQYDIRGKLNLNASSSYDGWIDLFGFATSGNKDVDPVAPSPWETSKATADYRISADITNTIAGTGYDWLTGNELVNGIGRNWYLMSKDEWTYLLNTRKDANQLQGQAVVNDVNGYILLPDEWECPVGISFKPLAKNYTDNVYSEAQWNQLEDAGAVFLPAAGYRYDTSIMAPHSGYYWTGDLYGTDQGLATSVYFTQYTKMADIMTMRCNACAIRPVYDATMEIEDGINSLTPALSKGEGAIYNLSGQRVNKPVQKGLYIINGKKMMVK